MGASGSKGAVQGLSKKEYDRMQRRFQKLAGARGKVALTEFQALPEMAGNPFSARIFQLFDQDGDGFISFDDFALAMEALGKMYTDEEKMRFAFTVYDLDADGAVSKEDLLGVLNTTSRTALAERQLAAIVDTLMLEYDNDSDGRLSFQEFKALLEGGSAEARPFLG